MEKKYLCIDLKSFYASVECVERGLDPMQTNLVVADDSRTEKTICLAVTPALKAYKIPGRARLFEVVQKVKEINESRQKKSHNGEFCGDSFDAPTLAENPDLALSYIVAPPRMALYMKYSTKIYEIYLRHVAPEDIHVYSVDEVFMDITAYIAALHISAEEFAAQVIREVSTETGITATAGIGTNLYLAKIAMDIVAKHVPANEDGVRIAFLDEEGYKKKLWNHRPLTDFWRIGGGYAKKLEANHLFTMGDIARFSLSSYGEDTLFKLFGVQAELLIDHAWGIEPCEMHDIKAYRPENQSISSGQVLMCPYDAGSARCIVKEMTDLLVLDLVEKRLTCDQIVLTIGYDAENLSDKKKRKDYKGEITVDHYGRYIPKHAHGTVNLPKRTSSEAVILPQVLSLFDHIIDKELTVRRINVTANHILHESLCPEKNAPEQMDLFTDYEALARAEKAQEKERSVQEAVILLKRRFGKNIILKGMNFEEGATAIERNMQIGGHKA